MDFEMKILYDTVATEKARAYAAGRLKLSEIIVPDNQNQLHRLSTEPWPPYTAKEVILEIAFEERIDLSPYLLEILDSYGEDYELPGWLLDTGRARPFSEAETMVVARSALERRMLPTTTPFWKDI